MNLSALSHITSNVLPKHTTNLNIGLCEVSEAASGQFAPETAKMQPRQPTPNTICNAPQNTKLQRKCCVDASPVHFLQRTSNDGNRLATHLKIRIQCPEPTPNYDLAAGNAPETTKRTSNHIAGCSANMQLE